MHSKKMPHRIFAKNQRTTNWKLRVVLFVVVCAGGYAVYHRYIAPVALPIVNEIASSVAPVSDVAPAASTPAAAASVDPVAEARAAFVSGNRAGARALLQPILDGPNDLGRLPQALTLASEIESAEGNSTQAMALLERVLKEFPGNAETPRANGLYANALVAAGQFKEADAIFAHLRDTAPKGMRAIGLNGLAHQMERDGDKPGAHALFREALADAVPESAPWEEALDNVGRLNVQSILAQEETPESKYYVVEQGDNLTGIGIKLNTTQGLLMRANGLEDESRLGLGQRLKYTPKDFRVIVERATCKLYLLDNDGIFKRYRTGLGMPGHDTALGSYTVGNKQKDPVWHPQGRPPVASGAPDNELGTRWMPLVPVAPNLPSDLGIHGTIAPETIGQYKSHGCPRMLKEDVEELYDLIVRSTPVQIVEQISWDEVLSPSALPTGRLASGQNSGVSDATKADSKTP